MKKSIRFLLFSLVLVLQSKSQAVITNTSIPQPTANINPCYNMGFESTAVGSYSSIPGWTFSTTGYTNTLYTGYCLDYPLTPIVIAAANVMNAPYTNAAMTPSFIPPSPYFGNNVFYLTSTPIAIGILAAEKTFSVTPSNIFFEYAYLFTLYRNHQCCDAPYIKIRLLDQLGNAIPCGSVALVATTNTTCTIPQAIPTATNFMFQWTPNWIVNTFDLSAYVGTSVKLKIEVGSCTAGGHPAMLWFDARCSGNSILSTNGALNGNTVTVCNQNNIASLTLTAANSCTWNGPPTSSIVNMSSSSISTSVSGVYSVSIYNPNCGSTNTFTYLVNFCSSPTLVKENEKSSKIIFYPNPNSGSFTVKGKEEAVIQILDVSGRVVESFILDEADGFTKTISELRKGIYIISANNFREKIIVLE